MNNKTLISILVPVYGVEKYIERCAESLFEQTYPNLEYIFVDDCTPDKSIEKLKNTIKKYPNRAKQIHIIKHDKNRGLAAARNTAVNEATGDFILHVDSDDWIDKSTVELIVAKQIQEDADIIIYEFLEHYKKYTIYNKVPDIDNTKKICLAQLAREVHFCIWGELIRRSLYTLNKIATLEGYNMAEDYQVTPKLAYFAKKIAILHKPLYHYDKTNENSYTYNLFNDKNSLMLDKAMELLYVFFKNKGQEYLDSFYKAVLRNDIREMMNVCKTGGYDDFYKRKQAEIDGIDKKYYCFLSIKQQLFIKLLFFRPMLNLLCRLSAYTKHFYMNIKYSVSKYHNRKYIV